jgi:hypothetical protein
MGEENHRPTLKWWQWVLMYPTLAIAVAGSVPTLHRLYLAFKLNVPISEVDIAARRSENFRDSNDCLPTLHPVPGGEDADIWVGICPRKVLAILIQPYDSKAPIWRMIFYAALPNDPITSLLVKEAAAEEAFASFQIAQAGPTIICRKQLDKGRLLIRISYPNGQCVDQTVNTYTGVVIRTVPAPCDRRC